MKPTIAIAEQAAFWQLPIASLANLAKVLGTSPQQLGKMDFPRIRFGGQVYCRPIELAHQIRALKAEVRNAE